MFFKRLERIYGSELLKNEKYQEMITQILAHNNEKASKAIGRLQKIQYENDVKRMRRNKAKTIKLPDIQNVIPKRSVFLIKGADSGKMISETLRDSLQKDLRKSLEAFQKSGKPKMEFQAGRATGKINPELITHFQESIIKTFESRTKRDPKTGVPPNVRNIAVTEIRSTVNMVKENYKSHFLNENPQMRAVKTWLHNPGLSKIPRENHRKMHKVTVEDQVRFAVPKPEGLPGYDFMDRPHDPTAGPKQIIGCSCDIVYKITSKII